MVLVLLTTTSAVITFVTKLEEETANVYQRLAREYPEGRNAFLSFSQENLKNKTRVERTYYSVISDALEACFSFGDGVVTDAYATKMGLDANTHYSDVLKGVLRMEETFIKLYVDLATLAKGLMADIPRVFILIARKREARITSLRTLAEGL